MYFFWTIVLLPLTAAYDIYAIHNSTEKISHSAVEILSKSIQRLLFTAFPASWYIIASVIAAIVIYWIPKKYNKLMMMCSFALYLICCVSSNYYYLFGANSAIIKFDAIFTLVFYLRPHISFLVAFIWMGIGKVCAEGKINITPVVRRIGIVISAMMLYIEYFAITTFSLSRENDCYIMLVPLCFFIFLELKSAANFKVRNAVTLRKMSTIIYCSHVTVREILGGVFKYIIHFNSRVLVFVLTVLVCIAVCWVIFNIEKKQRFSWLKYSH